MKSAAPDIIPEVTVGAAKAALKEGMLAFARARGLDPQTVTDAMIDNQVVALRSAARRQQAIAAQHPSPRVPLAAGRINAPLQIRDPSDGSVTRVGVRRA